MDESEIVCYKLLSKIQDTHLKWGRAVLVIYFIKMFQIQQHFSKYRQDGAYEIVSLSLWLQSARQDSQKARKKHRL